MKKRFKEWRDSLPIAQTVGISVIVALIAVIFYTIFIIDIKEENFDAFLKVGYGIVLFMFIFMMSCIFLNMAEKLEEWRNLKAKANFYCRSYLSADVYKEIFRRPESYDQESELARMDFTITEKEGCRYWIKLLPGNKYHLMVQDRNKEVVYEVTLGDWIYLNAMFRFNF